MLFVRLPRFRPLSLLATGQSRGPKVQCPESESEPDPELLICILAAAAGQHKSGKWANELADKGRALHSGTLTRKGNACSIFGHLHSCLYMLTPDGLKIRNVYRRQETMTPRVDHSFGITAENKAG